MTVVGTAPSRRWWAFLGTGLLLVVVHTVVAPGTVEDLVYVATGLLAVVAVGAGRRGNQPRHHLPWRLLAAGLLLWVVGDAAGSWPGLPHGDLVVPLLYAAGYPLLGIGIYGLVRAGELRRDLAGVLDAATVAAALGVLAWMFLASPVIADPATGLRATAFELAFLVGDIVLVGGLVRVAVSTASWTPAPALLLGAVALVVVGDAAQLVIVAAGRPAPSLLDTAYLVSYLLWGASALHPTMTGLTERRAPRPYAVRLRLAAAGTCACLPVLGAWIQQQVGLRPDVVAALLGTMVVSGLVMGRQQLAFDRVREVTEQTRELRDQLAFEATHDALTLLPNRGRGLALLQGALDRLSPGRVVTVMFLDLDGFKRVNDVFGHTAGDQLLRRLAERMRHSTRGEDVAIRLGGDEFVVVLETLAGPDQARLVAERLIETVSRPVNLGRLGSARVGASIGIAQTTDADADPAQLLDAADVAAYEAKSRGKGCAVVYDEAMRESVLARDLLADQLREGVARDELELHYQPVVDSFSGEVRGYEALVRWRHPDLGLLPPAQFLPVAEAAGLVADVDRWVLREATQQLQRWVDLHGFDRLVVAVNLSPTSAAREQVVADVGDALLASGLRGDRLVLELPERVLQDQATVAHLRAVRAMGVSVSICDFGSAVSQIARLADLPVNVVKIGRDALDLGTPLGDRLLQLMVQGAHAVGLGAVAEGVERDDQLATLRSLDCELVQGFHVARPMPAIDVPGFHGSRQVDPFSGLIG